MKMIRTWGDIQFAVLQLMRSYTLNGNSLWGDTDNLDYMYSMAEATNYALRDLAAEASPLVRMFSLSLNPVPNMLGDGPTAFQTVQSLGQEITYQAINPKAFYFETDRPVTVLLQKLGADGQLETLQQFPLPPDPLQPPPPPSRGFVATKGLVTTLDGVAVDGTIRLCFAAETAYNIRNVAFYAVPFTGAEDVPPFTRYDRYDLRKLTAGHSGYEFMRLPPNSTVQHGSSYRRSDEFRWEGDSTMVFDHYAQGQWDIYYYAYPEQIYGPFPDDDLTHPPATPMEHEPALSTEALDIVPLYVVSRIYTEEKPDLCSLYLNQYMVRRAELADRQNAAGLAEFVSESGWI